MSDSISTTIDAPNLDLWQSVKDILMTIDREREREIVSRRYGLYERRETLEQIGELLGITRERVRQLEKGIMARLKSQAEEKLPAIKAVEAAFVAELEKLGGVARISELTAKFLPSNTKMDQSHVAFLSSLAPNITVHDENDDFFHSVAIAARHTEKGIEEAVKKIIEVVKTHGEPINPELIHEKTGHAHAGPDAAHALATTSKHLAFLRGNWGLLKWPTVNPKNIRDKIYVVLQDSGKPLHFNEISAAIKGSEFKRKNVTTQAIHNELIKDKRFVLIGRGIYALKEWGYDKGTVADIITDVLKKAGEPLHRDEIVKRVLKARQVKETTILLNLQGKPQFKRTAKATYTNA
jgi:DNA-directed RNA polymerase delta subunit/transcriptional regulator with XRE-family HTH domain